MTGNYWSGMTSILFKNNRLKSSLWSLIKDIFVCFKKKDIFLPVMKIEWH